MTRSLRKSQNIKTEQSERNRSHNKGVDRKRRETHKQVGKHGGVAQQPKREKAGG